MKTRLQDIESEWQRRRSGDLDRFDCQIARFRMSKMWLGLVAIIMC